MKEIIKANKSERIDKYLKDIYPNYSRNFFINNIKDEKILVNDKKIKPSYNLNINDIISIDILENKEVILEEKQEDLEVVYEDEYIAIINKPLGLVSHPADSYKEHTLVNLLLYNFKSLSNINSKRPGIVHRLDKDTSGLMIICKTDESYLKYQKLFQKHKIEKKYWTLVEGSIDKKEDTIDTYIKRSESNKTKMQAGKVGKKAITMYKVLETTNNFSLLEVSILTGRTHQIRAHMQYINHPLYGDIKYGCKSGLKDTFYLISKSLKFNCPFTNNLIYKKIPLTERFKQKLKDLGFKILD